MKALGLIFVFLSISSVGVIKSEAYLKSERKTKAFIEFLYFIKREISSYLTLQEEIFEKYEDAFLEKTGFLKRLRGNCAKGSDKAFFRALQSEGDALMLKKEVYFTLLEFSESLGSFSVSEEVKRCDRAILELEEILKKQRLETSEKTRLIRTLFFSLAFGVVLLMI